MTTLTKFNQAYPEVAAYLNSTLIPEIEAIPTGGDVASNTATSVVDELALFADTSGKLLKRATGSGIVKTTSGVYSTVTAPSGAIVGDTDTQTLTNKTIDGDVNTLVDIGVGSLKSSASDRLLGRDTAGAGAVEELTVSGGVEFTGSGGIQTSAFTGDVTKSAGGTAQTIANDAVTFGKMQNIATDRLLGRDTAATGDVEELTVSGGVEFSGTGGIQRSALTGDVTASAGSNSTTIANDAVTYAKIQNVSATNRILGRSTAGAGDVEEITVGGDLTQSGSSFTIANNAVTLAKLQDITSDRLLGRDTAASGDPEQLTVSGGIEFTGSGGIQTSAFTGDVTKSAGGTALTIANDAVTYAKMQNVSAASKLLGRGDSGAGDPQEITLGTNLSMSGTTLNVTGGSGDTSTNTGTSVADEIVLFADTTGKLLKRATGSGIVKVASGVYSTVTAPSGAIVGDTDTQSLTNKTLTEADLGYKVLSPAQITANQNNYNPGTGSHYRLSSDASRNITGIVAGTPGEIIHITNVGSNAINFLHQSASSTAGNRFITDSGGTITVLGDEQAFAIYDNTTARWRIHKIPIRPSGNGLVKLTSDALSVVTAPSGVVVGDTDTQTLTNKTIDGDVNTLVDIAAASLKLAASDRLLGRDTAGAGAAEELTVSGGLEFSGSGGIQRSALTGDVTASAGSNSTTIANDAVTFAKFQNVAANSVPARAAGTSGDLSEVALSASQLLGRGSGNVAAIGLDSTLAITTTTLGVVSAPAVVGAYVTKSQITSNQNNYSLGAGLNFRISSDANRNITGFVAGSDGEEKRLINTGSFTITLTNEDAASTAANRLITGTGLKVYLFPKETATMIYDNTTARWRLWN